MNPSEVISRLNHVAMAVGYSFMVLSAIYTLFFLSALLAELVIGAENRILIAFKVQPAVMKYFKNRAEIDVMLKEKNYAEPK